MGSDRDDLIYEVAAELAGREDLLSYEALSRCFLGLGVGAITGLPGVAFAHVIFLQGGLTAVSAELHARRRLERYGVQVVSISIVTPGAGPKRLGSRNTTEGSSMESQEQSGGDHVEGDKNVGSEPETPETETDGGGEDAGGEDNPSED